MQQSRASAMTNLFKHAHANIRVWCEILLASRSTFAREQALHLQNSLQMATVALRYWTGTSPEQCINAEPSGYAVCGWINRFRSQLNRTFHAERKKGESRKNTIASAARSGLLQLVYARKVGWGGCLLYTSPSPRDGLLSRMPSSA